MTRLYLFDLDGTIIRSYLREGAPRTPENYAKVELLSGRKEFLDQLLRRRRAVAFVTNQGGVAFGYQAVAEVLVKLGNVYRALGNVYRAVELVRSYPPYDDSGPAVFYVSYGHPKATIEGFKTDSNWRKPGAGMILRAMQDYGFGANETIFVGDRDSDREAAEHAGTSYVDAGSFFGAPVVDHG